MCGGRRPGPAVAVSEICSAAVVPALDGLASPGNDKQVKTEEGEEPEGSCCKFKRNTTGLYTQREIRRRFFWCVGCPAHVIFKATGQVVLFLTKRVQLSDVALFMENHINLHEKVTNRPPVCAAGRPSF